MMPAGKAGEDSRRACGDMTNRDSINIPYTDLLKQKHRVRLLAPFVGKYRQKRDLLDLDSDLALAFHHGVTTPDKRFFYLKNSKAGCTTIAQLLHVHAFGDAYDGNIHTHPELATGIRHWRTHLDAIENPKTVKFTFTRHPADRLRSAFFNFFVDCENEQRHAHWDNMVAMGFAVDGDIGYNFDVFLDYVALNFAETERHCDQHWRGQWISMGSGQIDYDFIGKLENFQADIAQVFARAGLPARSGRGRSYNRSSNAARDDLRLTQAQIAKIRTLYAVDYEAFGYA